MTSKECIKYCGAVPSTKYIDRYDVNGHVNLIKKKLTQIPILFGVVKSFFDCSNNQLTTLDHLPKYIGGDLYCQDNPFQNLNALKDVKIIGNICFSHETEKDLDCWLHALYNTDLDALEYHYDNHRYEFWNNRELENYVMNELEEIIKIKTLKRDLNNYI